ncbi:family 20 glycosylhydrolase [Crossiella cryophila]
MKTLSARPMRSRLAGGLAALVVLGGATLGWASAQRDAAAEEAASPLQSIVPVPASVTPAAGVTFTLGAGTRIQTQAGSAEATQVADYLASILRRSTGYPLPITPVSGNPADGIALLLSGAPASVGEQGYQLDVAAGVVTVRANKAAGLFAGVQTLRQLLPAAIESGSVKPGPWTVPGAKIVDQPRFGYRGAHLDSARHFFTVDTVKRYIDQLALYKINNFHWHLTDDQGWRIQIDSWPNLTKHGASTQVGGGPGGFYTKAQYADVINYAKARHITVIPEVDIPGHTNAALSSYAELNCNGVAPPLRTDTEVGYSSLCIGKDITYKFVEDVIRELAAITPGEYFHLGGDEAHATSDADYNTFMQKVMPLVGKYGKKILGWHEFVKVNPAPPVSAIPQFWGTTTTDNNVAAHAARGGKVLLSPANKAYLDMKYNASTPLGLSWAGFIEVQDAYNWNPGGYLNGVNESAVFGVEAPLWSETLVKTADIEFMAFPRLPAIAELGWSPRSTHNWDAFKQRLAAQGPRWGVMGINYYKSPQVPWPSTNPTSTTTTSGGSCSAPAWKSTETYVKDNSVSHKGKSWTARWWTRGEEPGTTGQWGVWKDNGAC